MPKSKDRQIICRLKEEDNKDEQLEDLLMRLEKIPSGKNFFPLLNNQSLQSIVSDLENDIISGAFAKKNYVYTDVTMMPALVAKANSQHGAMNLQLSMTPEELIKAIKKTIDEGSESARFLIGLDGKEAHFSVMDYRDFSTRKSLILFETTSLKNPAAEILALTIKSAIEDSQLSGCCFSIATMNIRMHSSESGVLSLALAKKLYLEYPNLLKMHIDNINGDLCKDGNLLPSDEVDKYLPPSFYKHASCERRIKRYAKENPNALSAVINKDGDNLVERARKKLTLVDNNHLSFSIYEKRIREYKSLIQ